MTEVREGPRRAAIAGWGMAVPEGRLTNADLEARGIGTSNEWILERTGISERRMCAPDETTAGLAIAAGNAAIKSAGIAPGDLGMVIVATCTPEQPIPETSSFVADGLGVRCGAFDVGAACAGFSYGLVVATGLVAAGTDAPILLIGAENLTRVVEPTDRGTVILFGDGAGATVIVPSERRAGRARSALLGHGRRRLGRPPDRDPRRREPPAHHRRGRRRRRPLVADGRTRGLPDGQCGSWSSRRTRPWPGPASQPTTSTGSCPTRPTPGSSPPRPTGSKIPAEKCIVNIDRYGNTSAASIPIALAEAADDGRLSDGDIVLSCGFGAGMTWSSAVLRWGRPV